MKIKIDGEIQTIGMSADECSGIKRELEALGYTCNDFLICDPGCPQEPGEELVMRGILVMGRKP